MTSTSRMLELKMHGVRAATTRFIYLCALDCSSSSAFAYKCSVCDAQTGSSLSPGEFNLVLPHRQAIRMPLAHSSFSAQNPDSRRWTKRKVSVSFPFLLFAIFGMWKVRQFDGVCFRCHCHVPERLQFHFIVSFIRVCAMNARTNVCTIRRWWTHGTSIAKWEWRRRQYDTSVRASCRHIYCMSALLAAMLSAAVRCTHTHTRTEFNFSVSLVARSLIPAFGRTPVHCSARLAVLQIDFGFFSLSFSSVFLCIYFLWCIR